MKRLLFLPLLCLLLAGCGLEEAPTEIPEDVVTILEDPTQQTPAAEAPTYPAAVTLPYLQQQPFDPITCPDGVQQTVASLLYEPLFRLDPQLQPQSCLCTAYSYDPLTFTYTLTLRQNVTFGDGSLLRASDVVSALLRAKDSLRYGARLASVVSVRANREGQVVIVLNRDHAALPALLDIPIAKATSADELIPTGTGPYLCLTDSSGPYLSANPDWWQGRKQPLERIELRQVKDEETAAWLFSSREVQLLITSLTEPSTVPITGAVDFTDIPTTVLQYLGINTAAAPLNDPALRRLLSTAIDREMLVSAFLSGHALAAQFPLSPQSLFYPAQQPAVMLADSYQEALAAGGWRGTLRLVVHSGNSFHTAMADYLAQLLSSGELVVEVTPLAWQDYLLALQGGQYDLCFSEVKLAPDWDLAPLIGTGGSLNYGGYTNLQTDTLLAQSLSQPQTGLPALLTHLQQEAPLIPLCFLNTTLLLPAGMAEAITPTAAHPFYGLENWVFHLSPSS